MGSLFIMESKLRFFRIQKFYWFLIVLFLCVARSILTKLQVIQDQKINNISINLRDGIPGLLYIN